MNDKVNLIILAVFDIVIAGLGIYFVFSAIKMKRTKEIGTFILTEEEVQKCREKEALAAFFYWREGIMGGVFLLFGIVRLLDKFIFKIGGVLDIALMLILLLTALWFFKGLQTARARFLL